jgi:hypothetical protein
MVDLAPKIEGVAIVLIGSFNPAILQPAWLASESLVSKDDSESAEISVIHPEISSFTLKKMQFEITRDRFIIQTTYAPSFLLLRDLAIGVFGVLHYTPINMMGLNRDSHFEMVSRKSWHEIGHKIAPKAAWANILEKPGMRSLTMEGVRPDEYIGYIRVMVEPSTRVDPGVYIQVNDHYQVKEPKSVKGCGEILGMLNRCWEQSMERSKATALRLLGVM